jgi:hypothetical protein
MDKEVRATRADLTGAGLVTGTALGKSWRRALVFGALAGMAVGILNVLAVAYRWKLADYFDLLDFPFFSLRDDPSRDPLNQFYSGRRWYIDANFYWRVYEPGLLCGIICYWTFIGCLVGSLFCFVRAGVVMEMIREKAGRWMLFFGACGGMFIGCLNFLAASNGWEELERFFDGLERPITWLMDGLEIRFNLLDYLPADARALFVYSHIAVIVYWAVIGLLVAWLFGVARIVGKRIAAEKR